jgi:electron transfer flavoprotein alpha subunit
VSRATATRIETLVEPARRISPTTILISSGYAGQEIAARVAVRLDSGIVSDAIDIRMGPDGPVAVQSVLGGSYLVESSVVRGIPLFTLRTQVVAVVAVGAASTEPTVRRMDVTFPVADALGPNPMIGRRKAQPIIESPDPEV